MSVSSSGGSGDKIMDGEIEADEDCNAEAQTIWSV